MRVVATRGYDGGRENYSRLRNGQRPSWKSRLHRPHGQLFRALAEHGKRELAAAAAARVVARALFTMSSSAGALLYLLDVYAKSAKEDLTDAEKREINKLVAAIEAED